MSTRKHEAFTQRRVLHESELIAIRTRTSPICTSHVFRQLVRVLFVYIASSNTLCVNTVKCSNIKSQEQYVIILTLINVQNF